MKPTILFTIYLIILSCSGKKSKTEDTQDSIYYDTESIEGTIPEDIEAEKKPSAPEFNDLQFELINYLADDNWIEKLEDKVQREESTFSVVKSNGFYRFDGLVDDSYYLSDIEVWDKESFFLTFYEGDMTINQCYSLSILSDNLISIDPFDQCARAAGYPITYTRNGIDDEKAGLVEYTITARWESIDNFQGDLDFVFATPEGGKMTFALIETKDYSDFDNPYFESMESEDSIFPLYVIKEEIKDVYYMVTYISDLTHVDLADEEQEVLIITRLTEIE